MIVNYTQEGWQVITQRSHGIVAAQVAAQWQVKDRPQRWVETLLAIAEHDDAENELDGEELLTPTGGPLNFDMKKFELAHAQKLSSLTISKSRYIALLTSMHMEFLYNPFKNGDAQASIFLAGQKKLQNKWREELGLTKTECTRIYDLMEWCDAFSLLICKGSMQPEKRKLDISTGPDKKMYELAQVNETTLTVSPWPFQPDTFSVSYEYRLIEQIQFSSSKAFRNAFLSAPVTEKLWQLQKGKSAVVKKKKV